MRHDVSRQLLRWMSTFLAAWVLFAGAACSAHAAEELARPLTKDEVMDLLKGYVSPGIVADIVRGRGVGFKLDQKTEADLRAAGATDELIKAVRDRFIAPEQQQSPVLSISATPGESRVYVDDKLMGTTDAEGKLKLPHLTAGVHWVRISHDGYGDYEEPVILEENQTAQISAKLEALQTPAEESRSGDNPAKKPKK